MDALFSDGEVFRVKFNADEIAPGLDTRHAGRTAAHKTIQNGIAGGCVVFDNPNHKR